MDPVLLNVVVFGIVSFTFQRDKGSIAYYSLVNKHSQQQE
jgi:hypothetical protein